ncbi:hypothetical protein C8J56DRAFT_954162 [Mycena floridula]|nr:hypothetical protein C8J56DRAFT_954162 [Mycena floridula]
MPPRYSTFALLWLLLAGTESLGKIALILPDVVVFERDTDIQWTRSAEDPTDFGIRTVPSTNILVEDLQPDGTGLSGTVVVLFVESSDGITEMALEAFDKSNPNDVLFESTPFHVDVSGGGSGGETKVPSGSRPKTSDTTTSSATTKTATSARDSASSITPTQLETPTSSSARFTTSVQVAGATSSSLSQKTFTSSAETFTTGLPGPDSTTSVSSPQSSNPGSSHHVPPGTIAGGIAAAMATLGILGGILFCWLRRRKR